MLPNVRLGWFVFELFGNNECEWGRFFSLSFVLFHLLRNAKLAQSRKGKLREKEHKSSKLMSFLLVSKISLCYQAIQIIALQLRDNLSPLKGLIIDTVYSYQVHTSELNFVTEQTWHEIRAYLLVSRDSEGEVGLCSTYWSLFTLNGRFTEKTHISGNSQLLEVLSNSTRLVNGVLSFLSYFKLLGCLL